MKGSCWAECRYMAPHVVAAPSWRHSVGGCESHCGGAAWRSWLRCQWWPIGGNLVEFDALMLQVQADRRGHQRRIFRMEPEAVHQRIPPFQTVRCLLRRASFERH